MSLACTAVDRLPGGIPNPILCRCLDENLVPIEPPTPSPLSLSLRAQLRISKSLAESCVRAQLGPGFGGFRALDQALQTTKDSTGTSACNDMP